MSRLLLAVFAVSLGFAPEALAKDPKCKWRGEGKDPFTGRDNRTVEVGYYMGSIRYGFHAASDGKVVVDVFARVGRALGEPLVKPIQFLLANGKIFELAPESPTPGSMSASSNGVSTLFEFTTVVPEELVKELAASGGVTLIRYQFPGFDWDMEIKKGDQGDIPALAWCATNA